ncbi:DUF4099 domain-containing protein [Parabacteroides sp. PF5-9]|uniref:DUF4099 domain-containing protein n=1 Tax=Parabacteroides sp. PF5-9 TaxID=1742404 RepID=UPI0024730AA6|nr:DUF4099 domain-containing protein [Parabacteroides sp. PF5-9]
MNRTIFTEPELPYSEFAQIGLSKEDVLRMNRTNLENLMTGARTNVFNLNIEDSKGDKVRIEGKLSLRRNEDNTVSLIVHPVRQDIKNDIGLTNAEIDKLKEGLLVQKAIKNEKYVVQLDPKTNELLKTKAKDIYIPEEIKKQDRQKLLNGQTISLTTPSGTYDFKLDLLESKGYKVNAREEEQQRSLLNNQFQGQQQSQDMRKTNNLKLAFWSALLINPLVGVFFLAKDILTKDAVKFDLSDGDIKRLIDGKKTEVKDLSDIAQDLKGKLSIERNADNTASFVVHPVRQDIKNEFGLLDAELQHLKNAGILTRNYENVPHVFQLDNETNEVNKAKVSEIIPEEVKGVKLTEENKKDLLEGKDIKLVTTAGEDISLKIDLNNHNGLSLNDDRQKLITISEIGAKGIEEIYPDKQLRDAFLERNNLTGLYAEYQLTQANLLNHSKEDYLTLSLLSKDVIKAEEAIKGQAESAVYRLERLNEPQMKENENRLNQLANSKDGLNELYTMFKGNEEEIAKFVHHNNLAPEFNRAVNSYQEIYSQDVYSEKAALTSYHNDYLLRQAAADSLLKQHIPEWKNDLQMFSQTESMENMKALIEKYQNYPKITEAQALILENKFANNRVLDLAENGVMQKLEFTKYGAEKGEAVQLLNERAISSNMTMEREKLQIELEKVRETKSDNKVELNQAEAKLMTQMSNLDKDLKLHVTAGEQLSHNLSNRLFDQEQKINFDRYNPGVVSFIQTDANRAEYTALINERFEGMKEDIKEKKTISIEPTGGFGFGLGGNKETPTHTHRR